MSDHGINPPPVMRVPILTYLAELLECVCTNLEEHGSGPVCWCGVYPGNAVSFESCDECSNGSCGSAYVNPGTTWSYQTFPSPAFDAACTLPLAYTIDVGIQRCFPTMEEDGTLPPAGVITETALNVMQDQWALHKAIRCCEFEQGKIVLGSWTPIGPQGGCVGGFWTAYLNPYRWA